MFTTNDGLMVVMFTGRQREKRLERNLSCPVNPCVCADTAGIPRGAGYNLRQMARNYNNDLTILFIIVIVIILPSLLFHRARYLFDIII